MPASIASAFVEARRTNAVIASYPGDIPLALDDAYRIQDKGIALTGTNIGGWKVGRIPAHLVESYSCNRLAGPIFVDRIVEAGANGAPVVPVLSGFAAVEAELLLRVARTPPADISIDEARDYVDDIRFGIEIASSPFPGINDHGPAVTISDFGNNFGLVLGPRIDDWRERDLLNAAVSLSIDGSIAGEATLAAMLDGPFGAFRFLAEALPKRGLALQPGQWVSTGAITGVHRIAAGQGTVARFDGAFEVSCVTAPFITNSNGNGGVA